MPHVGGPILPPGVPTVLIDGRPAAVVGATCLCNGPLDTVVGGSATVLVGDRRAARAGSPTVHGGVVVSGSPTVLLGS